MHCYQLRHNERKRPISKLMQVSDAKFVKNIGFEKKIARLPEAIQN